jgi:hypothetical protein
MPSLRHRVNSKARYLTRHVVKSWTNTARESEYFKHYKRSTRHYKIKSMVQQGGPASPLVIN